MARLAAFFGAVVMAGNVLLQGAFGSAEAGSDPDPDRRTDTIGSCKRRLEKRIKAIERLFFGSSSAPAQDSGAIRLVDPELEPAQDSGPIAGGILPASIDAPDPPPLMVAWPVVLEPLAPQLPAERRALKLSLNPDLVEPFMLFGAALLVEVVTTLYLGLTVAEVARLRTFNLLENLAYLILQVVALVVIAVGYGRATYGRRNLSTDALSGVVVYAVKAAAKPVRLAGSMLLLFYLFLGLEFVILLVLIFIMFQGFLIYARTRDDSSLLVLLGFLLIFVAHVVVLRSILDISGTEYLIAAAVQFFGFLSLLTFVIRSGRVGSA